MSCSGYIHSGASNKLAWSAAITEGFSLQVIFFAPLVWNIQAQPRHPTQTVTPRPNHEDIESQPDNRYSSIPLRLNTKRGWKILARKLQVRRVIASQRWFRRRQLAVDGVQLEVRMAVDWSEWWLCAERTSLRRDAPVLGLGIWDTVLSLD